MITKHNLYKWVIIVLFILILVQNKRNNLTYNYLKIYNKYIPNYEEKYNELLNNYELINENYVFIPAQILNQTNYKINSLIYINKGFNDDVKDNSYVVNEEGLVGIVRKAYNNYSVVELVSSDNINIAIEINDCYGTLSNDYISDLINCEEVGIGDPIFTSKFSISSSNILVGFVKKIKNNKIYIKYAFNPYKIKFVGIIYDN